MMKARHKRAYFAIWYKEKASSMEEETDKGELCRIPSFSITSIFVDKYKGKPVEGSFNFNVLMEEKTVSSMT